MDNLPIFQCLGLQNVQADRSAYIFVNDDGSEERITYGSLFENTNRISRILIKAGIGKGDTFVLLMRNHPEFLYGLFSALSTGAIAVPIDPRSKGRKLAFQINNTKAKGIFLSDQCVESLIEVEPEIAGVPVLGIIPCCHWI
jgi:crotonobetaine/carnitine-CoA ligase